MDGRHDVEVGFHGHSFNSHVIKREIPTGLGIINNGSEQRSASGIRSPQGRGLLVAVLALAVLCFGLVAYILVTGPLMGLLLGDPGGFIGICDTPACAEISHTAVESGDFEKDPCQDFYSFACSKWQLNNPPPSDQLYSATNINEIKDHVDFYIKRLLEKPEEMGVNSTTGFHMYSSPKAFYESCLHFTPPEDETRIISELMNPLGGYKTLKAWKKKEKNEEGDFDLTSTVLGFLRRNAAPLFDITLDIDPNDKNKYALIVELPRSTSLVPNLLQPMSRQEDVFLSDKLNSELSEASQNGININSSVTDDVGIPEDSDYKNTLDRQVLYKMITDNLGAKRVTQLQLLTEKIGKTLNLSKDEIQADMESLSALAQTLEKIKPSHRSRKFWKQQNKVYNAFSIDSLQRLFDKIDWKQLIEGLVLGHETKKEKGENYGRHPINWENATIYVPYPDYLRRLSQAIQYTDKRTVVNVMLLMYIQDMLKDITPKKKDDEPRWKFCVHSTKSVFALEISSLYMRSFDPTILSEMRQDVESIFTNVKGTLLEFLKQSHWQDGISREESIKKIKSLKGNFIGPEFYLHSTYLEDDIKNEIKVQIDPKDFLGNVLLVYKIFRNQLYTLYLKKVNEQRATWAFVTFPTTVNAFYIQQFNSLVIPLAFLNPPNYVYGAPKYVQYATIALTIAHEALHALDSSGSHFDEDGKLKQTGNNNGQRHRGFLSQKSACVANQYFENFRKIIPFHHSKVNMYLQVDGNLTQNENLADIAGLQVALKTYQKYLSSPSSSELEKLKLPGLKFTRNQMYFVAVAQAYCANISPMGYIFLLEMDEHTPHPERINGMLMNIPEFGKAFKCSTGSRMNPKAKCSLW